MPLRKYLRRFPLKYRHIYKFYNFLNDRVNIGTIIFTVFSTYMGIGIGLLAKSPQQAVAWGIIGSVALFICIRLLKYVIVHFIKNTGSKNQFILPNTYFKKDSTRKILQLNTESIDKTKFSFATIDSAYYAAELNLKCYANGAWDTHMEDKFKRNVSHIQKNKYTFLFMKEHNDDRPKSFTHMLPVPEWVWKRYTEGEIKDNEFTADLICSPGQKEGIDKPYGIILFSVGSLKYQGFFQRHELNSRHRLGDLLAQAIAYHLKTLLDHHFEKEKLVPVLLQNESEIYSDFLKGYYRTNPKKSADGANILSFDLLNN